MVVEKVSSHVAVGDIAVHPGDDVVIPVNVTFDDGVLFNGFVDVIMPDGSVMGVEIVNGSGNVVGAVPYDSEGNYSIVVSYRGDGRYLPSNATGSLVVEKVPTNVAVGNITAYLGENVTIPINVSADDGVLFNGNVTIMFPDGSIQSVEIINGTGNASWIIPNEKVSQYGDAVSFAGDNRYLPSNATGIISVILVDVELNITVDKSLVYYGDVVEFVITVRNNGPGGVTEVTVVNVIPEEFEYISHNCSDINYQSAKGVLMVSAAAQSYDPSTGIWYVGDLANGEEAKLSILAHANFIGTKNVTSSISIAETEYAGNNASVNVTVIPVPTHIGVENVTAHPGENITVAVNVTADDDVPFSGDITVILPDGSSQTVEIVNGAGNVNWTVPDGYEGKYPVNATFDGNNRYLPSQGQGTVSIERARMEFIVENITTRPGNDNIIPIDIITGDGVPFNGNVVVELPDGTVKTVEIINGSGAVNWVVPSDYLGDYNYTVKFAGNDRYLPSNTKGIITVAPKVPVKITVGKITAKPGAKVTIPIEVTPEDGSLFNGNVTVTLPDGTKKTVEIINGKGSVDWRVPEDYNGTYKVIVTFDGDDTYAAANATGVVNVTPDVAPEPVNPSNETANPSVKEKISADSNATGNPILALLMVLAILGISIKRRK